MKKIIIASFMAVLMLLVPIITVAQIQNIDNIEKVNALNDEGPKIYITESEKNNIDIYVNNNFDGGDIFKARTIVSRVVKFDLEIDILELIELLRDYKYNTLISDGDINNPFSGLVDKIIEIIKGRLGYIYTFLEDGWNLIQQAKAIVEGVAGLPADAIYAIETFIETLREIPTVLRTIVEKLIAFQWAEIPDIINNYISDLQTAFNIVKAVLDDLKYEYEQIKLFLGDIEEFINWLQDDPWAYPIQVSGTATKNLQPFSGATIECRGATTTTNAAGAFSFEVDSTADSDSKPRNCQFGMHNCQISISEDDEVLKQSPKLLSYVFGDGEIEWDFVLIKGRSKDISSYPLLQNLMERFQHLFLFFRYKLSC